MQQLATLTLIAPRQPDGLRLVECLREKAAELYRLEIDEPDGNRVLVTDLSGSVHDLPTFLDEHLDQCAEALGIGARRSHLLVDRPQPAPGDSAQESAD